jgi:hypothetical protein
MGANCGCLLEKERERESERRRIDSNYSGQLREYENILMERVLLLLPPMMMV